MLLPMPQHPFNAQRKLPRFIPMRTVYPHAGIQTYKTAALKEKLWSDAGATTLLDGSMQPPMPQDPPHASKKLPCALNYLRTI